MLWLTIETAARNWADADTLGYLGGIDLRSVGVPTEPVNPRDLRLLDITANPSFQPFYDVGIPMETVAAAFGPTIEDSFAWKSIDGPREPLAVPLGPWSTRSTIHPNGALAGESSSTLPLPLRPKTSSLYTPSDALRQKLDTGAPEDSRVLERIRKREFAVGRVERPK